MDSEGPSNAILVELAKEEGIEMDLPYALKHFQGHALSYVFEELEKMKGSALRADFEADFRSRTFAAFEHEIKAIPGALRLIQNLKIPFAVASNGPRHKMDITLKGAGLLPYFEGRIFSAYDIGKWKPDPALFLHVAASLGVVPAETIVVEDSPAGLEAALAGGFQVFALYNAHNEARMRALGRAHYIRHLDELSHYLGY